MLSIRFFSRLSEAIVVYSLVLIHKFDSFSPDSYQLLLRP